MATSVTPTVSTDHRSPKNYTQSITPLRNPRHERFCQLIASGVTLSEAYISVGYSDANPSSAANQIVRRDDVSSRIHYLKEQQSTYLIAKVHFTKDRVLHRLDLMSRKAEAKGQLATAVRCEELIGKEVGMFRDTVDHNFKWNGDLNALTESQKAQLWLSLEAIAFKDNPAGLEAFRAETDVMMRTIEASSEVLPDEKADVTDGAGKDGSVPAPGPGSDSVDTQGLDD